MPYLYFEDHPGVMCNVVIDEEEDEAFMLFEFTGDAAARLWHADDDVPGHRAAAYVLADLLPRYFAGSSVIGARFTTSNSQTRAYVQPAEGDLYGTDVHNLNVVVEYRSQTTHTHAHTHTHTRTHAHTHTHTRTHTRAHTNTCNSMFSYWTHWSRTVSFSLCRQISETAPKKTCWKRQRTCTEWIDMT